MTPTEELSLLKPTNTEALKQRRSLISVGRVVGGGVSINKTNRTSIQLVGKVSGSKNTTLLIGTDTQFTALSEGTILGITGLSRNYTIINVSNDGLLTVDRAFPEDFQNKTIFKLNTHANPLIGSKDIISVNELFPHNLRDDIQPLVEFLRQYYLSENMSDLSGISTKFNTLYETRDVDTLDASDIRVLDLWFKEFAKTFGSSKELKIDERTFLKNVRKLYYEKGSQNGIKAFFRLMFDVDSEVYLPWEAVLIASDGKWKDVGKSKVALDEYNSELKGFTLSKGNFENNDGFLSDRVFLQDSWYYQQYSYDVKTEVAENRWMNLFKLLLHPAGFIVFSTLLLKSYSNTGRMPSSQAFGYIEVLFRKVYIFLQISVGMKRPQFDTKFTKWFIAISRLYFQDEFATRFVFHSGTKIEEYPDIPIQELEKHDYNTGSLITQVPLDLREWLTADGNYFATADGVNFGVPA